MIHWFRSRMLCRAALQHRRIWRWWNWWKVCWKWSEYGVEARDSDKILWVLVKVAKVVVNAAGKQGEEGIQCLLHLLHLLTFPVKVVKNVLNCTADCKNVCGKMNHLKIKKNTSKKWVELVFKKNVTVNGKGSVMLQWDVVKVLIGRNQAA